MQISDTDFNVNNLQVSKDIDIQKVNDKITIYNRNTKKGFLIGKNEYTILSNLDGKNGVKELSVLCTGYTENEILQLLDAFYELGFLNIKKKTKKTIKDFWRFKIMLIDGNKCFKKDGLFVNCASWILLWGSLPVFIAGLIAVYSKRMLLLARMQQMNAIPVVTLLIMFWILSAIHEVAHAVVARHYGASVPDIGLLFYCLIPYAYTNLTFISMLDKKWKKLCCLFAGMLANLMIAGIFGLIAAFSISSFAFEVAAVNVLLVLTNLMVFFKLDGYFIMTLLIDENHMRERAMNGVFSTLVQAFRNMRNGIGMIRERTNEASAHSNRMFMSVFGVLSIVYVPVLILSAIITAIQLFR